MENPRNVGSLSIFVRSIPYVMFTFLCEADNYSFIVTDEPAYKDYLRVFVLVFINALNGAYESSLM